MLIRVKTSFPLFSFGVLEINPITDFTVAQLCISAESASLPPNSQKNAFKQHALSHAGRAA